MLVAKCRGESFCAIELPQPARERVPTHSSLGGSGAWGQKEGGPVTPIFTPLNTSPKNFRVGGRFSSAASRAVAALPPFSILLEETGVFPKHGQPRVLWIGINDSSGRLGGCGRNSKLNLRKTALSERRVHFIPHLTIGRARQPHHAGALATAHKQMEFSPLEIPVSELSSDWK